MLLQAVLERYGDKFKGVTSDDLVKEFLGPGPSGGDKIKGGDRDGGRDGDGDG